MEVFTVKFLLLLALCLCLFDGFATKRTGGGGRRTSSSGSSWSLGSRSRQNPKPHTDITKLSYGRDTAPAPKPAPKPSAPSTNQGQNIGWNSGHGNTETKNVGWNVGSQPAQQKPIGWTVPGSNQPGHQPPPYSPGGYNTQNRPAANAPPYPGQGNQQSQFGGTQQKPIGWNVPGSNQPGHQPPPYSPGGYNTQNRPAVGAPPYPGQGNQHSQYGGAPPAYPGYGNQHNQYGGAPPAYPGHSSHNYPHYPQQSYNTHSFPGYHPPNYGHSSWSSPSYGGHYGNSYGSPFGGGGFGRPGGYGGFGGGGFGGGGFGGFGGKGYNPYNPHNGGFGWTQKKSGFGLGGVASHVGTFVAGMMLWNLATSASRPNYVVYHNYRPKVNSENPDAGTVNQINITNSQIGADGQAEMAVDFGNMTCITVYSAQRFGRWANQTIRNIEFQTKQAFPFGQFNPNVNNTGNIQFNFTIEPGRIIHNETVSITCCGSEDIAIDPDTLVNGKSKSVNCVHYATQIPFRKVSVVPLNVTVNITENGITSSDDNSTVVLLNGTIVNVTKAENGSTIMTPINLNVTNVPINNTTINNSTSSQTVSTPMVTTMTSATTMPPTTHHETNSSTSTPVETTTIPDVTTVT